MCKAGRLCSATSCMRVGAPAGTALNATTWAAPAALINIDDKVLRCCCVCRAPEQRSSAALTESERMAADVWAWAGIMVLCLTGRHPEQQQLPPLPSSLAKIGITRLLQRCWEAEPRSRPAAAELVAQLKGMLAVQLKCSAPGLPAPVLSRVQQQRQQQQQQQ